MLVEGAISVKAAIEGGKREVKEVYLTKEKLKVNRNFSYIVKLCKGKNITHKVLSKEEIDSMCSSYLHGGICAEVGNYQITNSFNISNYENAFFALLEGIEDPFNYGYALRSLYAAGCDAVFSPKRNWRDSEAIIVRSSGGASEFLPFFSYQSPDEIFNELKYNEINVICGIRQDAQSFYQVDFKESFIICFGGEKRGLSQEIMKYCDKRVFIPYQREFRNSLNACSAVSVIAFEINRQRFHGE